MNRTEFKPRFFVIHTARFKFSDEDEAKQSVVGAFAAAGSVARYLEALRPQDRPDYHVEDAAGREIEKIAHRDDYYSHASALRPNSKLLYDSEEKAVEAGWKFTPATGAGRKAAS